MTSTTHLSSLRRLSAGEGRAGRTTATVTFVVFIVLVLVATVGSVKANERKSESAGELRTSALVTALDDRLDAYQELLFGIRGGFGVDSALDRQGFHELISDIQVEDRLPGVQVIGVASLVDSDEISRWEARTNDAVRQSGLPYPDFEVHPPTDLEQALVIDYIEPQAGNERAFGLDFLSEPNRRTAAMRARDSGRAASTAPITLVQETATQRAFLVMLPIYRVGAPISSIEDRRAAFDGVVYAAFRMGDLLIAGLGPDALSLTSVIDAESNEFLFGEPGPNASSSRGRTGELEVFGRTWLIESDDESVLSVVERSVPFVSLFGGLLVAALLVALGISMRSARTRAVELAVEMTSELEALTESASEGIISVDASGRIVAWNSGAARIFGAPSEDMLGRGVDDLVFAHDRAALDEVFEEVRSGADPVLATGSVLIGARRADDTAFPAELSLSKWSARGRIVVTGFVRDVTDRLEAENRLTETTNMLLGVLGSATELSIIATDLEGTITVFNTGAERMLGFDAADVVDKLTAEIFHEIDEVSARADELSIPPSFEVFVSAARHGEPETRRWTYVRKDGRRLPVELTVTPCYDAGGIVSGFIGIAVDITERVAAGVQQQQLLDQEREMVVKLLELDRVKTDLVSTMSHELRTPLTSIIGYAELLADEIARDRADPRVGMVDAIDKNAQRLLALVENLLTLSKIESGSLHASREPCDVRRIVQLAIEAIAPLAASNDITVFATIGDVSSVRGDAPQIERVCLNLLTNAVKFSHAGGTVDVSVVGDIDGVTITITDHGIGIPADEREHLFTRFFRSRIAEQNAIQGSGLGLSIVADIVRRHRGVVEIDSVENVGTTVTVHLPLDGREQPEPGEVPHPATEVLT